MSAICNHKWKYVQNHLGSVNYGGPIIYGHHVEDRCVYCGKVRMKVQRSSKWKILMTRKQNPRHHQLQLL